MACLRMVEDIHRGGLGPLGLSSSEKEVSFQWLTFDYGFWRTQAVIHTRVLLLGLTFLDYIRVL